MNKLLVVAVACAVSAVSLSASSRPLDDTGTGNSTAAAGGNVLNWNGIGVNGMTWNGVGWNGWGRNGVGWNALAINGLNPSGASSGSTLRSLGLKPLLVMK